MPNEIVAKILSYVPDKTALLTCKRFNDIATNFKFFKLKFHALKFEASPDITEMLDNDELFDSMMKSNRRVNSLIIKDDREYSCYYAMSRSSFRRLSRIIGRFGNNIRELQISNIAVPANIIKILNLMPNLEQIEIFDLDNNDVKLIKGELKLTKLKKLKVSHCRPDILNIFDNLPEGVLQELSLIDSPQPYNDNPMPEYKKIFTNQHNIKKMTAHDEYIDLIEWNQIKLQEISLSLRRRNSTMDIKKVIKGQDKVENYKSSGYINVSFLNLICSELKSLINLTLEYVTADLGTPALSKLRKLKSLSVVASPCDQSWEQDKFLSFTQSSSLETLNVKCTNNRLTELTVNHLGFNFPQLKELKIHAKSSIKIVNVIIQSCTNLKILEVSLKSEDGEVPDDYTFQEGLAHEKLKSLKFYAPKSDSTDVPKLLGSCKNLEIFETNLVVYEQTLIEILTLQPNLKKLTMFSSYIRKELGPEVTHETIRAIKEHGKKLQDFIYKPYKLSDEITEKMLVEEFKDRFKNVWLREFAWCMWSVD